MAGGREELSAFLEVAPGTIAMAEHQIMRDPALNKPPTVDGKSPAISGELEWFINMDPYQL